jgi:hypothetical protein
MGTMRLFGAVHRIRRVGGEYVRLPRRPRLSAAKNALAKRIPGATLS